MKLQFIAPAAPAFFQQQFVGSATGSLVTCK